MGIVNPGETLRSDELVVRDALGNRHCPHVPLANLFKDLAHFALEVETAIKNCPRRAHATHVARRCLVKVGIDPGAHQRLDLDMRLADRSHQVADDVGRRDDFHSSSVRRPFGLSSARCDNQRHHNDPKNFFEFHVFVLSTQSISARSLGIRNRPSPTLR